MEREIYQYLKEKATSVSHLLLKHYAKIGLSDQQMMLILHLIAFQNEGKEFPTVKELENRMAAGGAEIMGMLQKLVQKEYIRIDEYMDDIQGVRYEYFDFDPLYHRIAKAAEMELSVNEAAAASQNEEKDLYTMFEQEFGRPLSPIECETLSIWIEKDGYSAELVEAALREAVVSGKINFRYIDRILFEWQRNNIRTAREAREHGLRFRQKYHRDDRSQKSPSSIPHFNWLEYEDEIDQ